MIIDITSAPSGALSFDPAHEDFAPSGGRTFAGLPIRENSYPNGCSSFAGAVAVHTPFGDAVVGCRSFCGTAVFTPIGGCLDAVSGGWTLHRAYEDARASGLPVLSRDWSGDEVWLWQPSEPCPCGLPDCGQAERSIGS